MADERQKQPTTYRTKVEPYGDHFVVYVSRDGNAWNGLSVNFETRESAERVVRAIWREIDGQS